MHNRVHEPNNGYFTFTGYDLQNDGTLDFIHERFEMPKDVAREDITPVFRNVKLGLLTSNIAAQTGHVGLELWNNSLDIKRYPVWNNRVFFRMCVSLNNQGNNHAAGFTLFTCRINGNEKQIRLVEENLYNKQIMVDILFSSSDNRFSYRIDEGSWTNSTLDETAFNAVEDIRIGNGRDDITLFMFGGYSNNTSISGNRAIDYMEAHPSYSFNIMRKSQPLPFILTQMEIEAFVPTPFGTSTYIYKTRSGISNLEFTTSSGGDLKFNHKSATILEVSYNDRFKYIPAVNRFYTPSWKFTPEQGSFAYMKCSLGNRSIFMGYSFTILEETNNSDRIAHIEDRTGRIVFALYPNRIEYLNNAGRNTARLFTTGYTGVLSYLKKSYVYIYQSQGGGTIVFIGGNFSINLGKEAGFNLTGSSDLYFCFNKGARTLKADLYAAIEAQSLRNEAITPSSNDFTQMLYFFENNLVNNLGFYSFQGGNYPVDNYSYINLKENLNTSFKTINHFDNLSSDMIIRSTGGASNLELKADITDIDAYIPVPYEFPDRESYMKSLGKRFVSPRMATKQISKADSLAGKETFRGAYSNSFSRAVTEILYVQYANRPNRADDWENVLFMRNFKFPERNLLQFDYRQTIHYPNITATNRNTLTSNDRRLGRMPLNFYGFGNGNGYVTKNTDIHYFNRNNQPRDPGQIIFNFSDASYINDPAFANRYFSIAPSSNTFPDEMVCHFLYSTWFAFSGENEVPLYIADSILKSYITKAIDTTPSLTALNQYTHQPTLINKDYTPVNPDGSFDSRYTPDKVWMAAQFNLSSSDFVPGSPYPPQGFTLIPDSPSLLYSYTLDNASYRIYGKVTYDGMPAEGMRMTIQPEKYAGEQQNALPQVTYTNMKGEYQFHSDSPQGVYAILCEDLKEAKYNTQIRDFTVFEHDESRNAIKVSPQGNQYVDIAAFFADKNNIINS